MSFVFFDDDFIKSSHCFSEFGVEMIFYAILWSELDEKLCTFLWVDWSWGSTCYHTVNEVPRVFFLNLQSITNVWFRNPNDWNTLMEKKWYLSRHCLPVLFGMLYSSYIILAIVLHFLIFYTSFNSFKILSYSAVHRRLYLIISS